MNDSGIVLYKSKSKLVINPLGARIVSLVLDGTEVLGTFTRGDGKQANSHPCTPVFGPDTTYGLGQHGPMRNELCEIEAQSDAAVTLRYHVDAGTYPKGLVVSQTFRLVDGQFSIETIHDNTGIAPMPVNFCEHFYWNAPQGWAGVKLNDQDVTSAVKADAALSILPKNRIEIPGQPVIILAQEGLPMANLWAMKPDTGEYDQHYVCIEPCQAPPRGEFFGSPASMLQAGQSKRLFLTIGI